LLLQLFPEDGFYFVTLILSILYLAGVIFKAILDLGIIDGHRGIITKARQFAIQTAFAVKSLRIGLEQKRPERRLEDMLKLKEKK
jgi:hypothetical protein